MARSDEEQPLLQVNQKVAWTPPPGFIWIQLGTWIPLASLANVDDFW